jgi:hypothetical protein
VRAALPLTLHGQLPTKTARRARIERTGEGALELINSQYGIDAARAASSHQLQTRVVRELPSERVTVVVRHVPSRSPRLRRSPPTTISAPGNGTTTVGLSRDGPQ